MSSPVRLPVRVAILNDYEIVVRGVAAMLADHPEIALVELDVGVSPVSSEIDVILYDTFALVADDGMGLAELVGPSCARVVVYAWTLEPAAIERALEQGAAGYLSKSLGAAELADALVDVAAGEQVVSTSEGEAGMGTGSWPGQEAGLTERQAEVLALVARGMSNHEIAEALFVSVNTVKTHLRAAYPTIGVETRAQAVAWCLLNGFETRSQRSFD